jgi:hypothetical protein
VDVTIQYEEPGCDFCGKTDIKKDGTYVEEDYSYLKGKYFLDNESFWYEVDSNLEYYLDDENPSLEKFIEEYDFVSDEDKEELKRMYNEAFANK